MTQVNKTIFAVIVAVGFFVGIVLSFASHFAVGTTLRDENRNVIVQNCTVYSDTNITVGNQVSSTILSASTSRAWIMIQRPENVSGVATNTVSVSIDGGAATLATGLELATSTPFLSFGTAGAPFTGAITGITSTGSTTVRVVECGY